jgi:transposase
VEVRIGERTLEVFHDGRRVAAHVRSHRKGGFTTENGHRPRAHQKHLEWSSSQILSWAGQVGESTAALADQIMTERKHPEQGYRACLGLMRLGKEYGPERLEAACERALLIRGISYRSVCSILQIGLDRTPLESQGGLSLPQDHAHVRGATYYATPQPEMN